MNMDVWVVDILNQLFVGSSYTEIEFSKILVAKLPSV